MKIRSCLLPVALSWTLLAWLAPAAGQSQPEDDRERQITERFVTLLERNPRRGTALDRVYGYHVERGSLDQFLKTYQDRVAKDPADGAAWLVLGLFESQRGRDAAAVTALRKAEEHRPADPLPCYYLGQALVLVGQPEAAAEAFERAIARKPARADLLEVFQALGRSYQRTRRNEQALAVWNRLEALFPTDLRVKEQIADALVEESPFAQALPRYEALATAVRDKYRQVQYRIEAAEIKVRLGKTADALTDFETLLGQLNPESWLYREVRRKIEDVFLRNDDLAGLASYYERWIKKTPDDVEALARLGRILANQGRLADARTWLEKAVKLAPSRKELRLALIEQLVQEGKVADAAGQYEALSQLDPRNLDILREWGRLLLKDQGRPPAARKAAAAAVWRRLIEGPRPDPLAVAQVADLFRQAEMTDEAIALYKKAIGLAPEASQYREYLGEYYHTLKRPADALATWNEIAAGPRRDAKNLARVGEVLAGFGYRQEAAASFAEACRLDDDEFDLRIKYGDVLLALERFDEALEQLGAADRLADDADQSELVLERRIKAFQGGNTLEARADALRGELEQGPEATAGRWLTLARYLEAGQKLTEAASAVRRAVELDAKSIRTRVAAARIFEMGGDLAAAAATLRELTVLDRRARSEYLANLAKLEARLGRREPALQAGRELLAAAPGNIDSYQTFADLCFQLGEVEEGLDALRRSVRANPADPKVATALAEALAQQFRTEEAVELYWRAFEKTTEIEGKLGVVSRLADLYVQRNQFDRLVARLERIRQEPDKEREAALCLAQAHAAAGDLGTARQELERLLAGNARDTQLLKQLSMLSETEGELAAAVKYQRQLVEIAPGDDASLRLAQLHLQVGETAEAEAVWARLASGEKDSARTLQAIDSLLAAGRRETVLSLTERLIRRRPDDWEALYREGVALAALDRAEEASRRFQAILAVPAGDDDLGAIAKARSRGGTTPAGSLASSAGVRHSLNPMQARLAAVLSMRIAMGLEPRYGSSLSNFAWSPLDHGLARMAALTWLWSRAQKDESSDAFLSQRREAREKSPHDPRPAWDWYYLQLVRQEAGEVHEAARTLSSRFPNDATAQWAYLTSLASRTGGSARSVVSVSVSSRQGVPDTTPPLATDEVDHVLAAFRSLRQRRHDWVQGMILSNVMTELKRAHRTDDQEKILRDAEEAIADLDGLGTAIQLAGERGDVEGLLRSVDRIDRLSRNRAGSIGLLSSPYNTPVYAVMRAIVTLADAKSHAEIPRVVDHYLLGQNRLRQAGKQPRATAGPRSAVASRVVIWSPGGLRSVAIDYPRPTAYLDQNAINLVRSLYEVYKRDDLMSDLFTAYRTRRDKARSDAERLDAHLILSALAWWENEEETAVKELEEAVKLAGGDADLSLELADLHERRREPDEALAIIERIEALDNTVLQQREMAALRLSVATGNIDRARLACDRLFGLRLDTASQTILAGQMHQLGMHEQAEAVLARARRRAGQQTATLVSLMAEYQRQDKVDQAVQVAHQILRRGSSRQSLSMNSYSSDDLAREEAVRVLARSGKLKETIGRLEAQAERSPNALLIQQTLADYYRASGDREKLRATYRRIAALKPDDARHQFLLANQLVQAGDAASAVELFRAGIARDPAVLANYQLSLIHNAFQQAKKTDEFLRLMEGLDFKRLGNAYGLSDLTSMLLRDPKTRERGRSLLLKAWAQFPEQRLELFSNFLFDDDWWADPRSVDLVRQAIIPTIAQAKADPWYGYGSSIGYSADGRVIGLAARLIGAASQQGKTAELAGEIESALRDRPTWLGGKGFLAILQARMGKIDEARKGLEEIEKSSGNTTMQRNIYRILAQEIEDIAPLQDVAIRLYDREMKENYYAGTPLSTSTSPVMRLIALYRRSGRAPEARALVQRLATQKTDPNSTSVNAANRRVSDLGALAGEMLELGDPVEAIRLYGEMFAAAQAIPRESPYSPTHAMAVTQANQGIQNVVKSVGRDTLGKLLFSLLEPSPREKGDRPAIDLVLMIHPSDIDQAMVFSLVEALISASTTVPEVRAEVLRKLEGLADRSPDDLAAGVVVALGAFADGSAESVDRATRRLAELVARTPLDPLSPEGRANARQRAEAARQLGLWLVARACWKVESVRDRGDLFAGRALEAATRQTDLRWTLAMHREWGQLALDRGDRASAESHWSKMLDLVLAGTRQPSSKPKSPANRPAAPGSAPAPAKAKATIKKVSQAVPPAPATPAPAGATSSSLTVIRVGPAQGTTGGVAATSDRFEQAMQIARMAADRGMPALSIRAAREALRGGPPVAPLSPGDARVVNSGMVLRVRETGSPSVAVETYFAPLVAAWTRQDVAAVEIYETLRDCVLPSSRPAEVFLYPRPLTDSRGNSTTGSPSIRSVGMLLVQAAVRAGRVDDLRKAIETRRTKPTSEPSASVLLAQLGMAAGDLPLARKAIVDLQARLRNDSLKSSAELVCHAALPALNLPALKGDAAPLLDLAVQTLATQAAEEPAWSLERLLARHWFATQETDKARKVLEMSLASKDRDLSRYSGDVDYVMYQRRQAYLKIAAEHVRAGQIADALDLVGRACDTGSSRFNYGGEAEGLSPALVRNLCALPAAARYEHLHAWTMPVPSRASVRLIGGFLPDDLPPLPFEKPALSASCAGGSASTIGLLVDAARELGKLEALTEELSQASLKKVEGAENLYVLVMLAQGRGHEVEDRLKARADEIHSSVPDPEERPQQVNRSTAGRRKVEWADYLIARACLKDRGLTSLGQRMADDLIALGGSSALGFDSRLRLDQAASRWEQAGAGPFKADTLGLAVWNVPDRSGVFVRSPLRTEGTWFGLGRHVSGVGGSYQSLVLSVPVTGSFDFSVEAYLGARVTAMIGYGGVMATLLSTGIGQFQGPIGVQPCYTRFIRQDEFNRLTLQVRPGKLRLLVNGHLLHEQEGFSEASPWISLGWLGDAVFRNPVLSGSPRVPSSVRLIDEPLQAWNTGSYDDTKNPVNAPASTVITIPAGAPRGTEYDWSTKGGVIVGRRVGTGWESHPSPSRLAYSRPLRDSETIRYQYFFEPGEAEVHPALGRLVFLLLPDGVSLHWMTPGIDDDWTGVRADNLVTEPANRRGPARLPLKVKDWNDVRISRANGTVRIALNDVVVYERPLEASEETGFSLYHDKDRTEARVRAVVLEGDWPAASELNSSALVANRRPLDAPARRAVHDLIGEPILVREAGEVVARARTMPLPERYAALAAWVLPGDDHATFRLQGDFTPSDPAPIDGDSSKDRGGTVEAPALELVTAAKELDTLEELAGRIRKATAASEHDRRGQLALLALVDSAQGRDAEAASSIEALRPLLAKVPANAPEWQRWPELVAVSAVHGRPPAGPSLSLLDDLAKVEVRPGTPPPPWLRHVRHALALAREVPATKAESSAGWMSVVRSRAKTRGEGDPIPVWSFGDGQWSRTPGDGEQSLEFTAPLRPPFEFEAELASSPTSLTQVAYGGLRVGLDASGTRLQVGNGIGVVREVKLPAPGKDSGPWHSFRLVVRETMLNVFVDDRKALEEPLASEAPPWLAIQSAPDTAAMARRLKVTGAPQIPRTVNLIGPSAIAGWSADEYGETATGLNAGWGQRGDTIVGTALKPPSARSASVRSFNLGSGPKPTDLYATPGSRYESVLRYGRPLPERGEVEYEFFFEPGKSTVSPAIGRLAFLLEPKGVIVHRLTDGPFERSGLAPDNTTVERENRRGPETIPLRPGDWNRLKVALDGNRLTLNLNDVEIYERVLQPASSRLFGLFHYADESEVVVRKAVMRGEWPKTLADATGSSRP